MCLHLSSVSGGHCLRVTWHIRSQMVRVSFRAGSVCFCGVAGGESSTGGPVVDPPLKNADISLIYFTTETNRDRDGVIQTASLRCSCQQVSLLASWSINSTLLEIKLLKRFFTAMPEKNHFWFHKQPFSQRFFKEPSFYNLKNLLSPQISFCETESFFRC